VSTCHADTADGSPCGANALTGSDYCRHHQPDTPEDDEAPWCMALDGPEEVALDTLMDLADDARSEKTRVAAAEAILKHVRER